MELTLHWWMLPLAIVLGSYIWWRTVDDGEACCDLSPLIFIGGIVVAALICLGHLL